MIMRKKVMDGGEGWLKEKENQRLMVFKKTNGV